jgi:Putative adhesin
MRSPAPKLILGLTLTLLAIPLHAQSFTTTSCNGDEGNTHNNSFFGGKEKVCELRRTTIPLVNGQITVSAKNGGIEVIGEDRQNIALEARVVTQESSRQQAESLLKEIKVLTDGSIRAEGPYFSGLFGNSWYVNFRLHVPRHLAAQLHSENGGINISNIDGEISAETTNGGLTLRDLAGKVHATTVNGGLDVTLNGTQWHGEGLFARSTNGGVTVNAPDHYSAHLIATTVNGGISVAFPITIQGSIRHHIDTQIGQGGPTIQVETTNGGVSIGHD